MKIKLLAICFTLTAACTLNINRSDQTATSQNGPNSNAAQTAANQNSGNHPTGVSRNTETSVKPVDNLCPPVKKAGKRQIKSQTFPFNFKPFENMCFVTLASVEQMVDEKDVPRGSTFHLYQNGESVLDLPDAFDGQEACWVEGVSFKDLNSDGLTDIIIAGSCLAARDSYPSNAVFVNNGKSFTTNGEANQKLENLKKLSAIEAFVKKNQKLFF